MQRYFATSADGAGDNSAATRQEKLDDFVLFSMSLAKADGADCQP